MTSTPPLPNGPLAAIDLGSNSFRLEIGYISGDRYLRQSCRKELVGLGQGIDDRGHLTDEAIERGLRCLEGFAAELALAQPMQLRVVATQTFREAANRDVFVLRAQAILGAPVEVIGGHDEARLIYAGVSFLHPTQARRLVVDIGGRSTELIVGEGSTPRVTESLPVGSASVTQRHFPGGLMTAAGFRRAQFEVGQRLEPVLGRFEPRHWDEALGASGTAGMVAAILAAHGITDGTVTPAGLRWVIERCVEAGSVDRLQLAGLKSARRSLLPGGVAVLYAVMMRCGIERLQSAKGALRQGVIVGLHEQLVAAGRIAATEAPAEIAIRSLQRRFKVDRAHSRRVASTALALHRHLRPDGHAHAELRWAAALHEVGRAVSDREHHRHSARLLSTNRLPGVSAHQQQRLGDLVLGQRGGLRKIGAALRDDAFADQLLCLRLALICCEPSDRVPPPLPAWLARDGQIVRIAVPADWADTHPRTLRQMRKEADRWARSGALELVLDEHRSAGGRAARRPS